MTWEKVTGPTGGKIFLMTYGKFGWGGETQVVNSSSDDIAPSIAQLSNGTIVLVWSRGTTGNFNSYNIYTQTLTNGKWSTASALVTQSPSNFSPVVSLASDGTLWLVWSRSSASNGNGDLYYKTLRNGVWSSETAIPVASSSSFEEKLPSLTQTADGKIWVCYESNSSGTAQLYCTTFNGSTWTSPIHMTTTSNADKWPSIAQDRNGTLWIFWARELPNGTSPPPNPTPQYQYEIMFRSSINNGSSWGTETTLYSNINTDEQHPFVFQGPDKELWIIFDSCCNSAGNPYGNPNLFIVKSNVIPAHDLAVSSITYMPIPNPRKGENVTFTVTVSDPGAYSESSILALYINSSLVGTKTVTIGPGGSQVYSFIWQSKSQTAAKYSAMGVITPVGQEIVTWDNSLNSTFLLVYRGDVNRDGFVNIVDLTLVASHFAAAIGTPGYYAPADLNNDGIIDIVDLTACAADFGHLLL